MTTSEGGSIQVLDQENRIHADQVWRALKPSCDTFELFDDITGSIGVSIVVRIPCIEHSMKQLFLGLEVVQKSSGCHTGLAGNLCERRTAPPITRKQPLSGGQNELFSVLALG